MTRQLQLNQPIHVQLTRRMAPLLIGVFAVLTLVGVLIYRDSVWSRLGRVHEDQLAQFSSQISEQLRLVTDAAQQIAGIEETRIFAESVRAAIPTWDPKDTRLLPGQTAFMIRLNRLMNDDTLNLVALRYIDASGSVWGETTKASGVVSVNTLLQAQYFISDAAFIQARSSRDISVAPVGLMSLYENVDDAVLRVFAPVITRQDGRMIGMVELTALALPILDVVNRADTGTDQHWILVDRDGRYLGDNRAPRAYLNSLSQNANISLVNTQPELDSLLRDQPGNIRLLPFGPRAVSVRVIDPGYGQDMPWRLIVLDDAGAAAVSLTLGTIALIGLGVLGCAVTLFLINQLLRRRLAALDEMQTVVAALARDAAAEQRESEDDPMRQIVLALKAVAVRVDELITTTRTQSERHSRNLAIANRISRETAALNDMDALAERVIGLICSEYGYYHAQIFLMDDTGQNAVLVYSHGLTGQRLLEHRPVIPVGDDSLVGRAAASGRVVVSNYLRGAPPLLPDTRAQMAQPLVAGGRVVGILDVHSLQPDSFSGDESATFQLLADQLAVVFVGARQLVAAQQRIQQTDTLNRQLTRTAWQEAIETHGLPTAYRYNLMEVQPGAADMPEGLTMPITIRGEVIGSIAAAPPEGQSFTEGDQVILRAVAERVGLAIEGARLFNETQATLLVTSTLYRLSRLLNEADTLEKVLKAIMDAAAPDASGGQVWLFDDYPPNTLPEWLEVAADWSQTQRAGQNRVRLRQYVPDSYFLTTLRDNQVKVVHDVALDQRLDSHLRQLFLGWGARAVVFVPFNVRAVWRGVITLEFARPREFSEREGRIYTALIDQAGVAIDNRLLFQQTENTLDRIERLYSASRIINSAQFLTELVQAAEQANKDHSLWFELGILEGELDETGWPTRVRKVARSQHNRVIEIDETEPLEVAIASPLRHRSPQVITDPDNFPPFVAMFPMFSANMPIAMLYLYSPEVRELTEDDHEVYQALTGQMSTMLENRRLLEQTEAALDQTRRLYDASRAITGASDLRLVYQAASEHLAQEDQVSRVSILLSGPNPGFEAQYFDYVHVWERVSDPNLPSQSGLRLAADAVPFHRLMAKRSEPAYFSDLDADLRANDRLRVALQRGGANSVVVISLQSQRDWFGVLVCECDTPAGFDEQYIRFAQALADQVAIAIENRTLFDEAQQEAKRALALAEAGQLATRIGAEFEQSINTVFARVAQSAGYDRWSLMIRDENQPQMLRSIIWQNPALTESIGPMLFDLNTFEHPVTDAVRLNRLIMVNDPKAYPAFQGLDDMMFTISGKHVVAPVTLGGETIGALMVGRALDTADLDDRDEQLAKTLAAQVSVAVENRRLFETAENERSYLRSILESMPTGIVVLDAQTLLPIQSNAQAEALLGKPIDHSLPFTAEVYNLYRTGTNVFYPEDDLPIRSAAVGAEDFRDDITVSYGEGSPITDLMMSAAPVRDVRGNIVTIVAALQNISNLRGLENALQDNLKETTALYEASRALAEAVDLDQVLDIVNASLFQLEPTDAYVVLLDEKTGDLLPVRAINELKAFHLPLDVFESTYFTIPDARSWDDAEVGQRLLAQGVVSLATTPLRARENLLGWIVIAYDQPRAFTGEDERFLTTLGDGAAVAIDNRNLLARTEIAYQEATTLYQIGRALANAATPHDIVMAIVNNMQQEHITQVLMAVPAPGMGRSEVVMQVMAAWQKPGTMTLNMMGIKLTEDIFPSWRILVAPGVVTVDDIEASMLTEDEKMSLRAMDVRSMASLPLRSGTLHLGTVWMTSPEAHTYTDRDQRLYQSFAEQASLSMQATRLLEQTERRARQLETSAEVSRAASSILKLEDLMPRLVDLIKTAFGYDHVQIFLMDDADEYAVLRASTGEPGRQLLAIHHRLAKGSVSVIGQVTATGEPALALDTSEAGTIHRPNPYLPLTRSEMALPLMRKDQVIGALDVQSNQPNAFSEEDVRVLSALAGQIAIAIDNALLFEQSQRRADDMGFLFTVTAAAALPEQGLSESLHSVAEMVLADRKVLVVGIYLAEERLDENGNTITVVRPVALAGSRQPMSELSEVVAGDRFSMLGQVAQRLETVIVADIERERRYLPIIPSARSAVIAPMASGSQLIGLIVLEDARPNAFNQETVTLLGTLSGTLSAVVQNQLLIEQVRHQNDQLRELDKLKSDFLANMSHELRTPLNSIIGFSRVILKGIDGPLTEMQEQDLTTIYNSGQHLLNLINDILDQAKINSGKMDLQKDYFDIKPVVEGVRSIGIGLVKDKQIDMRLDIASGMPKVYGDEFRTRQVLLNLVSNAAKFTQEGSITIRVAMDKDPVTGADMVRVDVADTGIGIAEKDMPLLFEAFRQVDSSLTRTVSGTGLGLPISKSLVEMQGGRMLVQSEINVGSTFSILIPLEPTEPITADSPKEKKSSRAQTGPLNGDRDATRTMELPKTGELKADDTLRLKRKTASVPAYVQPKRQILLIEDNPDMVDQFRRALQREGFDIFAASIPLEAEAMASGLRPTLIVMDVEFAGGAGWDILSRLQDRDDTRDIPVIVVTLSTDEDRAYAAGAFAFMQRPFIPDQLVEIVRRAERESQTDRILIIDDHPDSTRLIKQMLDQFGHYRVFAAHSGAEGVSMVARRRPDLILLDLRMPEMDGFAVLEELRANPEAANIPVMVITADSLNTAEQEQLGEVDVFYKSDLNRENYSALIEGVRAYLSRQNGE